MHSYVHRPITFLSEAEQAVSLNEVKDWARHPAFLQALETFTARRGISTAGARATEGTVSDAFPDGGGEQELHFVVLARSVGAVPDDEMRRPEPEGSPWRLIRKSGAIWQLKLILPQTTTPACIEVVFRDTAPRENYATLGCWIQARRPEAPPLGIRSTLGVNLFLHYEDSATSLADRFVLTCAHCLLFKPTVPGARFNSDAEHVVDDCASVPQQLSDGDILINPKYVHDRTLLYDQGAYRVPQSLRFRSLSWSTIHDSLIACRRESTEFTSPSSRTWIVWVPQLLSRLGTA